MQCVAEGIGERKWIGKILRDKGKSLKRAGDAEGGNSAKRLEQGKIPGGGNRGKLKNNLKEIATS